MAMATAPGQTAHRAPSAGDDGIYPTRWGNHGERTKEEDENLDAKFSAIRHTTEG